MGELLGAIQIGCLDQPKATVIFLSVEQRLAGSLMDSVAVVDDIAFRGGCKTARKKPMSLSSQGVIERVNGSHLMWRSGFGSRINDKEHELLGHE